MKQVWLLATVAMLIGGCDSEIDRLQRQLDTMEQGGAKAAELCEQKRELEDAYSRAGDSEKYAQARSSRAAECAIADMNAELGINE